MYYTINMKKEGIPAKTYELDVLDTLGDVWSIVDNLIGRCADDKDCSQETLDKLYCLKKASEFIRHEEKIMKGAIKKNPYYFTEPH